MSYVVSNWGKDDDRVTVVIQETGVFGLYKNFHWVINQSCWKEHGFNGGIGMLTSIEPEQARALNELVSEHPILQHVIKEARK